MFFNIREDYDNRFFDIYTILWLSKTFLLQIMGFEFGQDMRQIQSKCRINSCTKSSDVEKKLLYLWWWIAVMQQVTIEMSEKTDHHRFSDKPAILWIFKAFLLHIYGLWALNLGEAWSKSRKSQPVRFLSNILWQNLELCHAYM